MFNLENIIRKNIKELLPYSSARSEFDGVASIWLDANENPFDTDLNRYPDPNQSDLKEVIASVKNVDTNQIFIGNGSDEAIDLLFRAFCEPGQDKAYIFPPTYGMYKVSANINNIEIVKINLDAAFQLPILEKIKASIDSKGLLFICSPNNPTGNVFSLKKIKEIATNFDGLVIVDEAYIDFANTESATSLLDTTPNLIVLQTMSKAYGLAGLRLGMAFANPDIIQILNNIKPPYNINTLSQLQGIEAIKNREQTKGQVAQIITQRKELVIALKQLKAVRKVYPSSANFILAEFDQANEVYGQLKSQGVVIRNRTSQVKDALRITIGTADQNQKLIQLLNQITT